MVIAPKKKPNIPKGYEPTYTTYKLITETYYEKPIKLPKRSKAKKVKEKEWVQPVKVVNPVKVTGAKKASRKRRRGK